MYIVKFRVKMGDEVGYNSKCLNHYPNSGKSTLILQRNKS